MLQYVEGLIPDEEDRYTDDPVMFTAENQNWDRKTIRQLREEYGVIYNDGIWAFMVIGSTDHPLIAVGYEDDGTIQFPRQYGQFENCFSPDWIPSIIRDLEATKKYCESLK